MTHTCQMCGCEDFKSYLDFILCLECGERYTLDGKPIPNKFPY